MRGRLQNSGEGALVAIMICVLCVGAQAVTVAPGNCSANYTYDSVRGVCLYNCSTVANSNGILETNTTDVCRCLNSY